MLYEIHFRRDADTKEDFVNVGPLGLDSLEKAKEARKVSGDLVVYYWTKEVVKDPSWLWDWEKNDPNCYAQRAIKASTGEK